MKWIISGVPCSGKTYFGDWLRDERGFAHINLEPRPAPFPVAPPLLLPDLPGWLATVAGDVVVTWGFRPHEPAFDLITRFCDAGFTPWWFDADLAVARRCYAARDGMEATIALFDRQMKRITRAKPLLDALYERHTIRTLGRFGYRRAHEIYSVLAAADATRSRRSDAVEQTPAVAELVPS
jgi:hypothetical protein